jgi:ferritin
MKHRYWLFRTAEERIHTRKFMSHLMDRGALPNLSEIPSPRAEFESLIDIAKQAQSMERQNTIGIHACYETAQREKDFPAQVLLHWFINEQVEEEDWADELVDRVERANCAGGFAELDRHIERHLTDEPSKVEQ